MLNAKSVVIHGCQESPKSGSARSVKHYGLTKKQKKIFWVNFLVMQKSFIHFGTRYKNKRRLKLVIRHKCKAENNTCRLQYVMPDDCKIDDIKVTFCTFGGECSFKIKNIENQPTNKIYKCKLCSGVTCELRVSGGLNLHPNCPFGAGGSFFQEQKL